MNPLSLISLLSPKLWAGIGIVVLIGLVTWHEVHARNTIKAQAATIAADEQTIANDALALKIGKEVNTQLGDELAAAQKRHERATQLRKEALSAPQSDDGVVAPVLRNALDGLRTGLASNPTNP